MDKGITARTWNGARGLTASAATTWTAWPAADGADAGPAAPAWGLPSLAKAVAEHAASLLRPWTLPPAQAPGRNLAVDALRGLTLALMVMVNNPGNYEYVYTHLRHSDWHGCTLADFVFPFFLLISGISLAFSLAARAAKGARPGDAVRPALVRTGRLLLLGLVATNFPFVDVDWRIPGVLQRIALVYGLSTLIALKWDARRIALLAAFLLLGYWGLLALTPVPGIGAPDLSAPEANIAAWLDRALMGPCLYDPTLGWDPEGLLSTIPALCLSLIGVLTGRMLLANTSAAHKNRALFATGLALAAAGLAWSAWLPLNRWLWTSSFMLLAAGLGLAALAGCLAVVRKPCPAALLSPFRVLGANAIAVYMASMILSKMLHLLEVSGMTVHGMLHDALLASWLSTPNASLGWALAFTLTMYLMAAGLHARKIVIKV